MQNTEPSSDWLPSFAAPNSQEFADDSLRTFHSLLNSDSSPKEPLDDSVQKPSESENNGVEPGPLLDVFEEDARSSWGEEPRQAAELKESIVDESSQNSLRSQKSCKQSSSESLLTFPPEKLFEYSWPQANGDLHILQEQISNFLKVELFDEKYPDLARRAVESEEKAFLRDKGVIAEAQLEMNLTALRSEEVFDFMSKDFPEQHKECLKILRRETKATAEKPKETSTPSSDKNKMIDLVKKAVQSAADYNAHLNQERREERKSCMDLQTFTVHYPIRKNKVKKSVKPGKYPIALLPGQFQDFYQEYTPEELKYLPVNSVLFGPLKELNSVIALSDGSQSDTDDSTASDGSESSSPGTHDESSSSSEKNKKQTPLKIKPNSICKVCKLPSGESIKGGKTEELVSCSECENCAHPSCIELTSDVVSVITTYAWQCMDCKVCSHCRDPNDEDKMLFCDTCDRGYHTFCVGLKNLPQGKWICRQCGSCSVCGSSKPGPESSKAQWHFDMPKGNEPDQTNIKPKLICFTCHKKSSK